MGYSTNKYDCSHKLPLTWNTLFGCIAPLLIDEAEESYMQQAIEELIENQFAFKKCTEFQTLDRIDYIHVDSDSFSLIKVQFRALGFISLGEKKRSTSDRQTYWKLTPYGDYMMTTLLAISR